MDLVRINARCEPVSHAPTFAAAAFPESWQSLLLALDQCAESSSPLPYHRISLPLGADIAINSELCLLWEGRVRLLTQPPGQAREITTLLLDKIDSFGADACFGLHPPSYRAIAASTVEIVRIPTSSLQILLTQFPDWRDRLMEQAKERDRLLFLKTQTALQQVPSRQLRSLGQAFIATDIAPGLALAQAMPQHSERYWLRQGGIHTQEPSLPPPTVGDSWGYPESTPTAWITQTQTTIYRLPAEQWDRLQTLLSRDRRTSDDGRSTPAQLAITAGSASPPAPATATSTATTPVPQPPAPSASTVLFPKPVRRGLIRQFQPFPWVEQQSSSDCGAACLAMVLRYWGKRIPLYVLRDRAQVGQSGASLKNLAKAAEDLGFHARPVRASFSRMADQPYPWIAHWQGNHFVVVYRCRGNRVIIADPAIGRKTLSAQEFQQHWTGYALLLDPTPKLHDIAAPQASLGRYLSALIPYRHLALQIILVSLLIQIFGLVTPLFTQIILDQVVVQKSRTTLNVFAIGLFLFGIWGICTGAVRQYLLSYFSHRLDLTLISGFIRHALTLPLSFFESRRVGDILTRVQENQKIQQFLVGQIVLAWLNFLTGFVYLGLMLYYNWRLTLLVLALIPPIVALTLGATPFLRKVSREVFNEAAEQNSSLVEMMTGVATVKAIAAEQDLRWRWEDRLTTQMNAVFRGEKLGIGLQVTSGLINSIGSTLLLWYGATLVIQAQLTIGQFVAFNMMMGFVISPVVALANLWDELQEVLISVERLNDVFEATPEEAPGQALLKLPTIQGTVKFEDVTFRYAADEERNTLQNISFEAYPGQTIAIVGRSGSGKSTLANLIQGLYVPNGGRVLVDTHDIRHMSLQSLRSQIGVVPQDCFLFSGTILDNITLYRPEFTLEQAIEAAKLAEAHSFIQALPLGYNTKVGERGSTLSGGQRQRIAIARALLGNPRILILDEATSALDTESERRFQRNLMQLSRDRTTFIIAHRLSTVRHADTILVLDRGILVEQGTHDTLMAHRGLYYHLAQQQLDLSATA